jgi:hypothetical protein
MSADTNIEKRGRVLGRGLTELLFYMPVWLTIACYAVPGFISPIWAIGLLALYAIGAATAERRADMRIATRWLISFSMASLFSLVVGLLASALTDYVFWIASMIIGICVTERGSAMIRKGWPQSFHSAHMGVGILTYAASIPLSYWFLHELSEWRLWIAFCGIACVVAFMNIVNNRHLMGESVDGSKSKTLSDAQRRNRMLLAGLTVVMVVFAAFRQIQRWLEEHMLAAIKRLLGMLGGEEAAEPPPAEPAPPPQSMLPPMEQNEPSKMLVLLEQIVKIVVTIAIVAGALLLLYWLGRRLAVWLRRWMDKLLQRQTSLKAEDGAYTDEVEKLMSLNKWRDGIKNKLKSRRSREYDREPGWEELQSGQDRMRWLYRKWVRGGMSAGYTPQPNLTPRETAQSMSAWSGRDGAKPEAERFAAGYEAVRYGDAAPNESELERYRRWVEEHSVSRNAKSSKRNSTK